MVLDVAHNPHAAAALAANLDQMGFYPRTHAVFGVMRDKDIGGMLDLLAPLISHWYLTDLPLPRAATAAELRGAVSEATVGRSVVLSEHPTPAHALAAAVGAADPADRIVVFGSFYTVGGVLKDGLPRSMARRLG